MPTRRPLVMVNGFVGELPAGDGLPPELVGGSSPIESTIINLPNQLQNIEVTIARSGTLATQNIRAWLGSTTDNDIAMLEGVSVRAECLADAIAIVIDCQYFESGDMKIIYQVI